MKKVHHLLLFLLLSGTAFAQQEVQIDSSYANGHYLQRLDFFGKIPDQKNEIVFLGNSITEAGDWSDIIPEEYVLNRGISGDITFGVVARLDKVLKNKPSKLFVLIGVNDLKRGIPNEMIVQNYEEIVARVKQKSPGTELYLQSVLPINEGLLIEPFKMVKTENINYLNNALQELAKESRLVEYVNLWKVLADDQGQLKKEFTPDGIHLKPVAYIDWVRYLKNLNYL